MTLLCFLLVSVSLASCCLCHGEQRIFTPLFLSAPGPISVGVQSSALCRKHFHAVNAHCSTLMQSTAVAALNAAALIEMRFLCNVLFMFLTGGGSFWHVRDSEELANRNCFVVVRHSYHRVSTVEDTVLLIPVPTLLFCYNCFYRALERITFLSL